ncbi:hypothetical protein [Oerskovia enterophila]|uniref:Uncharacterized protein n=1 Tax=Oerskovia enterophila TaxID=43678 RepID=A0ABX2Y3A2_9CELL|nr:hypothetical protein [Oerskovia enterophila]OCI31033.1 hypothetical protein OERS_22430 [Oerskovia enterophila]
MSMEKLRMVVYGVFAVVGIALLVTAESTGARVLGGVMAALGVVSVVMATGELRRKRRAERPDRPEDSAPTA